MPNNKQNKDSNAPLVFPQPPLGIRADCKAIGFNVNGVKQVGDILNIVLVAPPFDYWGLFKRFPSPDKAKREERDWKQIWFVVVNHEELLDNIIFVSYIKSKSLDSLQVVTDLDLVGKSISSKVLEAKFERKSTQYGSDIGYVVFKPIADTPQPLLDSISQYLSTEPVFHDNSLPPTMIPKFSIPLTLLPKLNNMLVESVIEETKLQEVA